MNSNLNLSIMNTEETTHRPQLFDSLQFVSFNTLNLLTFEPRDRHGNVEAEITIDEQYVPILLDQDDVRKLIGFLQKQIDPAIVIEAVPRTSVEHGPEASPKDYESVISVEALDKEGWENLGYEVFKKGAISVAFLKGEYSGTEVLTASGKYAAWMKGVSSMQDLRQLEQLVNGK